MIRLVEFAQVFLIRLVGSVVGVAVAGVLAEAFLPRRIRYVAQVTLALGGLVAAFIAVIVVGRSVPPPGHSAVLGAMAAAALLARLPTMWTALGAVCFAASDGMIGIGKFVLGSEVLAVPIWGDESFADVARVTSSGAVLAAVRCATTGTDPGIAAVAPYASGRWLFSHNGVLDGWPAAAAGLAGTLPAGSLLGLEATW